MKKKWQDPERREYEKSKSEIKFESALKEKGFQIMGFRWYYDFTDYLVRKDGEDMVARHFRGSANDKVIKAQVDFFIDAFNLNKKIKEEDR